MAEPPVRFAGVLRGLRVKARLTQEELAGAAGVSPRAISDLERGMVTTPHRDTVQLLADALQLGGGARIEFEAAARGGVTTGRATADGAAATRTLPRDIASFTGRAHELAELTDTVAAAGGVVSIHAIGGMAGIGKTAFAVHAAHALAGQFPDGQIFLPLHGHTPGHRPVSPAEALASLLLTVGVPAGQIPADHEARAGLWRDRLAGRRLLLVLDDAGDSEQVRPLLPGSGGCVVLVTSRRRLTALEDARAISLDTLPPGEAAELFVRLAVRPGLGSADPGVGEITRLCGLLPLAVGMVARQLYHHPAWTIAGRAAELAAAIDRLQLLTTENLSVAAAFDLSYDDLTPGQQRLFRRLGLHPGADIDAYAAAALDGTPLAAARRGLEALYEQYLLTEPAPGRYRMHDLIREHARALAGRLDPGDDRQQAARRLLDYYQHAAARAEALVALQARTQILVDGTTSAGVPVLADRDQALAWARAERASLIACLDQATAAGEHARVIALTAGLAGLLRHDGPWADAIARHAAAVQAARQLGDRPGHAGALTDLGDIRIETGDWRGAVRDLQEALAISRDIGDRPGQARALNNLGTVQELLGDWPAAARDFQEALAISRDIADRPGQAWVLYSLGTGRTAIGDYPGAARDLEESLDISRDIGDRLGQANALTSLGELTALTGDYPGAARDLQEALGIYRDLGDRLGQANALLYLGERVRLRTGDYPGAARDLQEALEIDRDLGSRHAQGVTLHCLGRLALKTGDYPGAARDLQEALGIYRDVGYRNGEVGTLNDFGILNRTRGDLGEARSFHQQALDLARQIGAAPGEAHALAGLARCARAEGRTAEAETGLRQALALYQRLGAAQAAEVSAELDALPSAPSR